MTEGTSCCRWMSQSISQSLTDRMHVIRKASAIICRSDYISYTHSVHLYVRIYIHMYATRTTILSGERGASVCLSVCCVDRMTENEHLCLASRIIDLCMVIPLSLPSIIQPAALGSPHPSVNLYTTQLVTHTRTHTHTHAAGQCTTQLASAKKGPTAHLP